MGPAKAWPKVRTVHDRFPTVQSSCVTFGSSSLDRRIRLRVTGGRLRRRRRHRINKNVRTIATTNNIYTPSYPRIAESPSKIIIIIIIIQRLSSPTVLLSSLPCLYTYVCIRCLMFTLYQSRGIFFLLSPPHTHAHKLFVCLTTTYAVIVHGRREPGFARTPPADETAAG